MISAKIFREAAEHALALAVQDSEITGSARGLVTSEALVAEASMNREEWRLLVVEELRAWEDDLDILQKVREDLLLRLNQRPATTLRRLLKWLRDLVEDQRGRVDREIQKNEAFRQADRNAEQTGRAVISALQERCALPALRTVLNDKLTANIAESELSSTSTAGLYQQLPVGFELQSTGRRRVEHLLQNMTSASVGIAGPRGSGKTTLLTWVCDRPAWQSNDLRLMLPAPAKYEARDYLLYLLITLCKAILDKLGASYVQPAQRESSDEWLTAFVRRAVVIGVVAASGFVGLAVSTIWLLQRSLPSPPVLLNALQIYIFIFVVFLGITVVRNVCFEPLRRAMSLKRPQRVSLFDRLVLVAVLCRWTFGVAATILVLLPVSSVMPPFDVVAGGTAIFGAACLAYVFGARSKLDGWDTRDYNVYQIQHLFGGDALASPVVAYAREALLRASYQQARAFSKSDRVGISASLGVTLSADSTVGSSETLSTTPWTRPELVAEIRRLLQEIATRHGSVKIAIDELDKIESPEQATAFIDDIKGIFGVPQCHFLVSVSEDALAQFERRGMPFRTSFDSAFDEIVSLEYFSFPETCGLVRARVLGTPLKFVALCHAISGGLPRDLIRSLRAIYELTLPITLSDAASHIVVSEVRRKTALMATGLEGATFQPWSKLLAVWSEHLGSKLNSSDNLLGAAIELFELSRLAIESGKASTEEDRNAIGLSEEMAVFVYYCATIVQICGDQLSSTQVIAMLEQMARARQGFAATSALAWSRVNSVRKEMSWELIEFPSRC